MEIKKHDMVRFGYLKQSYFVHVPLVPPYCPHGWGPMGCLSGNF